MNPLRPARVRSLAALAAVTLVCATCTESRDADDTLPTLPVDSASSGSDGPLTVADSTSTPSTTKAKKPTTTIPATTAPRTTVAKTTTTEPAPTTAAATTTTTPTTAAPTTADPGASGSVQLGTDGLGVASFGDRPDAVIARLQAKVGAPTDDSGWVDPFTIGACPGDRYRQVHWDDLTLDFSDADGKQQFIGYAYGSVSGLDAQPTGLRTPQGIGIGATVAQLKDAYPDVATIPGEEGLFDPRFAVPNGVDGYLTGTDASDVVLSIEGGTGCQG